MNMMTEQLIRLALAEDIGSGDITTDFLIPEGEMGEGVLVAKEALMVAGTATAAACFTFLDATCRVDVLACDGSWVNKGDVILKVAGPLRTLLKGERTALNFLQRLSGIATHVSRYAKMVQGLPVRLVDTRKTTPGWRVLEKEAVRIGGAFNHRMALYDGVMIKDNHIAVSGGIKEAVATVRRSISHLVKVEVEVSNFDELAEAIDACADVIMLDNMGMADVAKAVLIVNGRALTEVSGNITEENLRGYAESGVDVISSGALTHQARSVDISMRM
ncbi:carboxylating nicotinate-nucleotide diphosphorylase [Desulfoluna sp.]|uniref:carboxylating nicotinate-nucleotide diphosphorylase n=1 Tax=Desulfoluna sp. TaxID=2045199 RepID=UPI00261C473B|nr:carboxylating nicotinate-nucleotide diphosphorylase [Desulfoluna sp.]